MALTVKHIINGPVTSNCFIFSDKIISDKCIIVDPGTVGDRELEDYLKTEGFYPEYIVLTHEHFDHIGGVEELRSKYGCCLVSTRTCSDAITTAKGNLSFFYDGKGFQLKPSDILIEECGMEMNWQGKRIKFIETPGHSNASLCVIIEKYLVTGDTLIHGEKTVVKLPGGSRNRLQDSINVLGKLKGSNYTVLPGHGEAFELDSYDLTAVF